MIVRAASGWQTVIADLALILFLITAQAVGKKPATQSEAEEERQPPASSSALAVHRPKQGESVREWLIASTTDQRQMATISVGYTQEKRAEALSEAGDVLPFFVIEQIRISGAATVGKRFSQNGQRLSVVPFLFQLVD